MLTTVTQENQVQFIDIIKNDHIYGSKIEVLFYAYGMGSDQLDYWIYKHEDVPKGVVCRFGQMITLILPRDADMGEIAWFIKIQGNIKSVEGEEPVVKRLNRRLKMPYKKSKIMSYSTQGQAIAPAETIKINTRPKLHEVFDILSQSDTGFKVQADYTSWACDMVYRQIKGFSKLYSVDVDDSAVCTAGAYFIGEKHAIIGGVATRHEHRDKGYASLIVQTVSEEVKNMGKTPLVFTAEKSLEKFYEKIGYSTLGSYMILGGQ